MKKFFSRLFGQRKPVLYLHIGLPKTGTSTIQGLLFDNTEALQHQNYLYPRATLGGKSDFAYAHHNLARAAYEQDASIWLSFQKEILANRSKKLLVSSEAFSNCRNQTQLEFIKSYLEYFDVKIIVYLRRQDDFLQALYQTIIVYGEEAIPFDDFYERMFSEHEKNRSLDYYFLVNDIFATAFGKENIIVRIYEKSQLYQADLLRDFLHTVGIEPTSDFALDIPNNNLSFDAHSLEKYRQLKQIFKGEDEFLETARRKIRDANQRKAFRANNIISSQQSDNLMNRVKESNEKLAREYLDKDDGILFRENLSENQESAHPVSKEEIESLIKVIDPAMIERYLEATRHS